MIKNLKSRMACAAVAAMVVMAVTSASVAGMTLRGASLCDA